MNMLKRMVKATWRWFHGLSPRGKAIVVGAIVIIAVIGSLTGEEAVDDPTDADNANTPMAEPPTPDEPTPTTEPTECEEVDGGLRLIEACLDAQWPLTVEVATVRCVPPVSVLLSVSDGPDAGLYAVNGAASTHHDYAKDVEAIWRPEPDIPDMNISIGPVIDEGLETCPEERSFDQRLFQNLAEDFDETDTIENFPTDQILGYGIGFCNMADQGSTIAEIEDYLRRHRMNTEQAAAVMVAAVNSLCDEHEDLASGEE